MTDTAPDAAPEPDLGAIISEQEQYARDVNAAYEAHRAEGREDEWPQWCDDMTAWNEAVAAQAAEVQP